MPRQPHGSRPPRPGPPPALAGHDRCEFQVVGCAANSHRSCSGRATAGDESRGPTSDRLDAHAAVLRHRAGGAHRAGRGGAHGPGHRGRPPSRVRRGVRDPGRGRRGHLRRDGSPFNKVAGLGFGGVPSPAALDEIERAFAACGAPVQIELAHLADPAIGAVADRTGLPAGVVRERARPGRRRRARTGHPAGVEVRRERRRRVRPVARDRDRGRRPPRHRGSALARGVPARHDRERRA